MVVDHQSGVAEMSTSVAVITAAAESAKVVFNARNANALEEIAATMDDAKVVAGDITDRALPAQLRLARAAVPHMRAQQWGRICFIASVSVRQPIPDLALSNVARTALWAWTKTAAQDLADDGITVNIAAPGLHATERLLERGVTGRTGDPADFGKVVAFLCSEPANFVNGIALGVDGGAVTGLL